LDRVIAGVFQGDDGMNEVMEYAIISYDEMLRSRCAPAHLPCQDGVEVTSQVPASVPEGLSEQILDNYKMMERFDEGARFLEEFG